MWDCTCAIHIVIITILLPGVQTLKYRDIIILTNKSEMRIIIIRSHIIMYIIADFFSAVKRCFYHSSFRAYYYYYKFEIGRGCRHNGGVCAEKTLCCMYRRRGTVFVAAAYV